MYKLLSAVTYRDQSFSIQDVYLIAVNATNARLFRVILLTSATIVITCTWIRVVNLVLSSGGLVSVPGYWKSTSSPSKFHVRRMSIDELTNCIRLFAEDSMSDIEFVQRSLPPTDSRVLSWSLIVFKLLIC